MDRSSAIRAFVMQNFFVRDAATITDNASLIALGVVDSTGVLEIINFMEESFSIVVDEAEMVPENLDSIAGMVAFVERKLSRAEGAASDAA